MLGILIGGFIVLLVGLTLAPVVANEVQGVRDNGNVTGASNTIMGLTTLFYCLAIAGTGIGIVGYSLRNAGLM